MHQHILAHGGVIVADVGDDVCVVVGDEVVGIQRGALGGGDGAGLPNDLMEQLLAPGIGLDLADLQAKDGADGVDGGVHNDLFPDVMIDVVLAPVSVAAAVAEALKQMLAGLVGGFGPHGAAKVHLHAAGGGGYAGARLGHRGAQNAGTDEAVILGKELEHIVVVAQTVNQRDADGVGADDGLRVLNGLYQLRGLGHEDDDIDLALLGKGIGSAGVGAEAGQLLDDIPVLAALLLVDNEMHAVLGDLLHVGLIAVDQDDIRSAVAEIGSKNTAGSAGTIHSNFHRDTPFNFM